MAQKLNWDRANKRDQMRADAPSAPVLGSRKRTFRRAKYATTCGYCGVGIQVGDPLRPFGNTWKHARCSQ